MKFIANHQYLTDWKLQTPYIQLIRLMQRNLCNEHTDKRAQWQVCKHEPTNTNSPWFHFQNVDTHRWLDIRGGIRGRDLIDYRYHHKGQNQTFQIIVIDSDPIKPITFSSTNELKPPRTDYDKAGYKLKGGQDVFDEGVYCFKLKSTGKQFAVESDKDSIKIVQGMYDCKAHYRFRIMRIRNNVNQFRIRSLNKNGDIGIKKDGSNIAILQNIKPDDKDQHWAITQSTNGYVYITNVGTGTRLGQDNGSKHRSFFKVWNADADIDNQRFQVKLHSKVNLTKLEMDRSMRIRTLESTPKEGDDNFIFEDDEKDGHHSVSNNDQVYCIAPANAINISIGSKCLFNSHFIIKKSDNDEFIIQSVENKYLEYRGANKGIVLSDTKAPDNQHWRISQKKNGTFNMLLKLGGDQLFYITATDDGDDYNTGTTMEPDSNSDSEFILIKRRSFTPSINQTRLYCIRLAPTGGVSYPVTIKNGTSDLEMGKGECSDDDLWMFEATDSVKEGYHIISNANQTALSQSQTGSTATMESNKLLQRQIWFLTINTMNNQYIITNMQTNDVLTIMKDDQLHIHPTTLNDDVKGRSFEIKPVACPSAKAA